MTVAATSSVQAAPLPSFANVGTENTAVYNFQASFTGDLHGYFAGQDAGYTSTLGLLVNGTQAASGLFSNHSTAVGASHDFGHVNAGDRLTFFIQNAGGTYYSDASLNQDGINHVYATAFAGNANLPAGTYVGFEDLYGGGDEDYNDLNFVLNETSNSSTSSLSSQDSAFILVNAKQNPSFALSMSPVPVPAALPMFGAGLLALGLIRFYRRRPAIGT